MVTSGSHWPDPREPAPDSTRTTATEEALRRRAQLTIIVGLFVTLGGLYGYALQFPIQASGLATIVPWLAVGFVASWTGGILAGNSFVTLPRGASPALRGQSTIAAMATLAGALSATVAVLRIGPRAILGIGTPDELVVAVAATGLVWIGGFLMGCSIRRFVLRRRRRGIP
jgi:hypothetical protein